MRQGATTGSQYQSRWTSSAPGVYTNCIYRRNAGCCRFGSKKYGSAAPGRIHTIRKTHERPCPRPQIRISIISYCICYGGGAHWRRTSSCCTYGGSHERTGTCRRYRYNQRKNADIQKITTENICYLNIKQLGIITALEVGQSFTGMPVIPVKPSEVPVSAEI